MDSWPFPEFRSGWDSYFKDKPDKPYVRLSRQYASMLLTSLAALCITVLSQDGLVTTCSCRRYVKGVCRLSGVSAADSTYLRRANSSPCSISWSIHSPVATPTSPARLPMMRLTLTLAS